MFVTSNKQITEEKWDYFKNPRYTKKLNHTLGFENQVTRMNTKNSKCMQKTK